MPAVAADADESSVLVGQIEGLEPDVAEQPTKPTEPAIETTTIASRRKWKLPDMDDFAFMKVNMTEPLVLDSHKQR